MTGRALTIDITTRDQQTLAALKRIQRELGELDKSIETTARQGDKLGASADEYARKLASAREIAGGIVLGGTVAVLGGATVAAGNLAEAQAKANAVFKDGVGTINEFAEGATDALALSKREALESASTFGNLFTQLGMGTETAAEMSTAMIQLGGDFAAFHNANPIEVIEAQTAAFRGEYDALQRFVPTINAATVEKRALAETGKANAQQLTAQEKALATYNIMLENAGDAEGAAAREADGLAMSQKRAKAELENSAATIGEALVPAAAAGAGMVADLASAFGTLPAPVQTGIVGIGGLTLGVGLLSPKVVEGAKVMGAMAAKAGELGQRAAQAAMGLAVPSSALDGLGSSSRGTTSALGALNTKLNNVSASSVAGGLALAGAGAMLYAWADDAARASARAQKLKADIEAISTAAVTSGRSVSEVFIDDTLPAWFAENADLAERFGLQADELWAALERGPEATRAFIEANKMGGDADLALTAAVAQLEQRYIGAGKAADAWRGAQVDLDSATTGTAASSDDAAAATSGLAAEQERAAAAADRQAEAADRARSAVDAFRSAEEGVASAQDAVVAAKEQVVDAERAVADAREGVADAARGVQDAERGLAEARQGAAEAALDLAEAEREQRDGSDELRSAQEGVADAERALAEAQAESLATQEALNDARATATERLEDLRRAVEELPLDEREARLRLAQAQERQAELDSESTALDREAAAIAVARAEIALREALEEAAEKRAELAEQEALGVEQSAEVVAAKDAITEAAEREKDAQGRLTEAQAAVVEAQEQMAQRVVEAQARVQEANDRVREAAERVRDANGQVAEAQQRVVDATAGVVEARGAVEEAERGVTEALAEQAIKQDELNTAMGNAKGALDDQIVKLLELAGQMEPGSPVRQRMFEMAQELNALTARPWTINLVTSLLVADAGQVIGDSVLGAVEAAVGGGRSTGGSIGRGQRRVVGERGPEIVEGPAEVLTPEQATAEARREAAFAERDARRSQATARPVQNVTNHITVNEAATPWATVDLIAREYEKAMRTGWAH